MSNQVPVRPAGGQVPAPVEDTNVVISWLQELLRQAKLAWALFFDPRVAWTTKLIPPLVLGYVIFPFDFIPDLGLGLGQLDDIAVLLLGTKLFIELCPPEVVREHLKRLGAKITEWSEGGEAPTVIEGEVVEGGPEEPS